MRVLHLSSYDLFGGAGRAAFRLHTTLRSKGVDSIMLVRQRQSGRSDVLLTEGILAPIWRRVQRRVDRLPLIFKGKSAQNFSLGWVPDGLHAQIAKIKPDLIHLHWVSAGFFHLESLQGFAVPLVWTMHDMWTFTGGCHYSGSCLRYQEKCGCCPVLGSARESDASRSGWKRRTKTLSHLDIDYIAPSHWLAERAKSGTILGRQSVGVIYNGLDTTTFYPVPREEARHAWSLPVDKVIILAGAMGLHHAPRKGFQDLMASLAVLGKELDPANVQIVSFGSEQQETFESNGFRVRSVGVVTEEEKLVSLYAAADLFVAPSREDNLPNTLIEAMATGTPGVAYAAGGIPEIVDDGVNGILVPVGDIASLGKALAAMARNKPFRQECGRQARDKVLREFSQAKSAEAYFALYEKKLAGGPKISPVQRPVHP